MENEDQLVHAVDNALYAAKNAGRNRIFLAKSNKLLLQYPVLLIKILPSHLHHHLLQLYATVPVQMQNLQLNLLGAF